MTDAPPSTSAPGEAPCVLVFRKRLLPYSETFIAAQGRFLSRWRACYAGVTEDRSGSMLLDGTAVRILSRYVAHWWRPFAVALFKRLGVVPGRWLRVLRGHGPRLVHAHFGPDALWMGLPLARALGLPLIVTIHGFDITVNAPRSRYQRHRRRLFEQADRVLAVSDFIAAQLVKHGCPPEKIITHYIGIDLEHFVAPDDAIPRQDVVFVGRLAEKKGCRYLILAMILLARRGHHHHLHILGDGKLRRELEELAQPLGNAVTFHGQCGPERVRERVGRAAVFCVPSVTGGNGDSEGLPMVNLEAMALRTPVVSTVHSGIPEAVLHEQTGILVPEADPEALAAALLRCLSDAPLARKFADNGLAHVRRHFDLRHQCRSLEAIYDAVAAPAQAD